METVLKLFIEFLANVAILVLVPMLFVWLKDKIGEALIVITPFDPQIRSDINQMLENQGFTTILWHEK